MSRRSRPRSILARKVQLIRRIDMVPEPYPQGYVPSMVFTQPPVEAAIREHAAFLSEREG